jgi:hypothetical protein
MRSSDVRVKASGPLVLPRQSTNVVAPVSTPIPSVDNGVTLTKAMATTLGMATAIIQTGDAHTASNPRLQGRLAEATLRATTPTLRVADIMASLEALQKADTKGQLQVLFQAARKATDNIAFRALPAAAQLGRLQEVFADKHNMPHWVYGDGLLPQVVAAVSPERCSVWNGVVVAAETITFSHDAVCAREVTLGTHSVVVHSPPQWPAHAPSFREVVDALSMLPLGISKHIDRIVVHPTTDGKTVASANMAAMNITIFKASLSVGSRDARVMSLGNDLAHESAHLIHGLLLAQQPALALAFVRASEDEPHVTGYAHKNQLEDFAETMALYVTTQGTPLHDAMRGLTPKRFIVLDEIMAFLR